VGGLSETVWQELGRDGAQAEPAGGPTLAQHQSRTLLCLGRRQFSIAAIVFPAVPNCFESSSAVAVIEGGFFSKQGKR